MASRKRNVRKEVVYLRNKTCTSDLMSGLNELRQQNILCNVNIKVGDDTFPAHKIVLSVNCEYFKAIFTSKFKKARYSRFLVLEEGSSETFGTLLRFAYTGNLRLTPSTIVNILSLSCYLQFPKAIALCEEYILDICKCKGLSLEIAMAIADFTDKHNFAELAEAANEYLTKNCLQIMKSHHFLETESADLIARFLQSPNLEKLQSKKEKEILDAMIAWLLHNWPKRKPDALKLLREVRLGLVPKEHLRSHVKKLDQDTMAEARKLLQAVANLLDDYGHEHPLILAQDYPKLCATRTQMTAPMVALPDDGSCYYDKDKKEWVEMPFCSPQVDGKYWYTFNHTLLVTNGELYAAGGMYQTGESKPKSSRTDSFCKYNPRTNNWSGLDNMNVERSACTLVTLEDYIYAIGGEAKSSTELSVERYNTKTCLWSQPGEIPSLPLPKEGATITAVGYYGYLLVYSDPKFHLYDPETNAWYEQRKLIGVIVDVLVSLPKPKTPKNKLNPLLVVHNDDCFLISYIQVLDGQTIPMTKPVVNRMSFSEYVLADKTEVVEILGESSQSQALVPINSCGAFIVNDEVFVNVHGCVHNTEVFIKDGQTEKVNLSEWEALAERKSFVSYTFDKQYLEKK